MDKPVDKPRNMHPNSLNQLQPHPNFTPEQASFFGRLGGLKRTQAKKKAAMIRMAKERRCVSCKYLDFCRMGIAGLASVEKTNKELINEVKCKIPATLLIMTDKLSMGQYEPLYDMMWHMLILEANDFDKKYKMLQSLERTITQKIAVVSDNKTEEKKEIIVRFIEDDRVTARAIEPAGHTDNVETPQKTITIPAE